MTCLNNRLEGTILTLFVYLRIRTLGHCKRLRIFEKLLHSFFVRVLFIYKYSAGVRIGDQGMRVNLIKYWQALVTRGRHHVRPNKILWVVHHGEKTG
jgi:hypothetical protein